ncbi:MAG: outer membrane protein assembly factor BamE [Desulfobacteraceae bacterium]|uniref:Outer membrane protein assembly factor BamE n=1 Tax=Candidatus Desulfaltia bathyphila TaxID=2841697 RepID=A0A8J6N576_9BACT|nr:outer membrane protein assembly factor BamE [Candidatus Desulfaltia bathyphila]
MKTSKPITATCQDISKRMATGLLISLLWVAVLSSGCATTGFIKKFDQAKISQIKEGETTRAEVEQLLGPPTWCSMNPLTQEITLGYFGDAHVDRPIHEEVTETAIAVLLFPLGALVPLLLPHHGTFKNQTVSVTISVDGKVTKISRQLRQSTGVSRLFQPSIYGNKIDFAKVAQIHEGETTTAELEKLLGVPQLITEESHEVTWTYQWNWQKGKQHQQESVVVTLDPQGKVKKLTKDSWRGTTRFYGNSSVPLDRNNLLRIQVGKTTREEVERLLGQPRSESVMEREAMTQTSLHYLRQLKKERFSCSEQVFIMLDANGVVESIN